MSVPDADAQLVAHLHRIARKSPKLVRSTVYNAPVDPAVHIRSWKMNEFKYYDVPSPFPTLARGLFTRDLPGDGDGGDGQIVVRGYDKFFNIGEVPWTVWSSLEAHTGPNYTLSVKSNGCIIFVAPISPTQLVVTSKHALGPMDGVPESHAQAGHRWLRTHLTSKDRTEAHLAAVLSEKKWTVVAELCDDAFEEHVLAYPPDKSGLYLHGINETRAEFHTLPTHVVDAFAREWGFLITPTLVYHSLAKVRAFTDDIAKTGTWNGEPLEGFVVRTHVVLPKPTANPHDVPPPYPVGASLFFKIKFDEPYMMYRDWREITKTLLSAKRPLADVALPKAKMKRKETQAYVKWVKREIRTNRSAFEGYARGKGVLATRERYLTWLASGANDIPDDASDKPVKAFGKTVLMPVAIPGCGKTAVAVALAHLFGFKHTQSDDVRAKKPGPAFIKNVVRLLQDNDVVIADKNNHQRQHRDALRHALADHDPPVRLLALHWPIDHLPRASLLRVCGDRIVDRGDRHQTLPADPIHGTHERVVCKFLQQTEPLEDDEVDACIEMDVCASLEGAVDRAVEGCVDVLGLDRPGRAAIDEAVALAKRYVPETTANTPSDKPAPAPHTRYFGILVEEDLVELLGPHVPPSARAFWDALRVEDRLAARPHVTLVHRAGLPGDAALWERCEALVHGVCDPPFFRFALGHLVWNDRVMAVTVDDLGVDPVTVDAAGDQAPHTFISTLPHATRDILHITIGTRHADVPAYEARTLVEAWRKGGGRAGAGIGAVALEGVVGRGRMRGFAS